MSLEMLHTYENTRWLQCQCQWHTQLIYCIGHLAKSVKKAENFPNVSEVLPLESWNYCSKKQKFKLSSSNISQTIGKLFPQY